MNLLVTGAFNWTENEIENLRLLGHNVVFMQQESSPLPCEATWVEGVITNGLFLYHPIESFTSLRFIQLTSAGFDRVPLAYIQEKRIRLFNARGVYSIPMAEFALCGVLLLYKQSDFFRDNQRKHKWLKNRKLLELYGKNVCIVGCGSVGNECAKRFKSFGCNVVGVDIKPYQNDVYSKMLSLDHLDTALSCADVTVLTLPLTKQTVHLINSDRFAAMKPESVLVNIARGAIVDTEAMIDALKTKIIGAVIDVFEDEPLSDNSPLWDMDNAILTPHNSFVGDGNHSRMLEVIYNNLKEVIL